MALFETKAPSIMAQLIEDFPISVLNSAAILGNIGTECAGFTKMQETNPVIPGSEGGYGWCQWTGPRRRAFMSYCVRLELEPSSDVANYAFLWRELSGEEDEPKGVAINALRLSSSLENATANFMEVFLRPGIPHLDNRIAYAQRALKAYNDTMLHIPPIKPPPIKPPPVVVPPPLPLTPSQKEWLDEAIGTLQALRALVK